MNSQKVLLDMIKCIVAAALMAAFTHIALNSPWWMVGPYFLLMSIIQLLADIEKKL